MIVNNVFQNIDFFCTKCSENFVSDVECYDNIDNVYFCPMCGQEACETGDLIDAAEYSLGDR
jgi:hypothetical protein